MGERHSVSFSMLMSIVASWCCERQIYPFQNTVENITSDLCKRGYEYRSVNNYRLAISAMHAGIEGEKVGQNPLIKLIMMQILNTSPPLPHYTETWDVDSALTLTALSLKVATLVAITSDRRASEICGFNLKYMPEVSVFKAVLIAIVIFGATFI